MRDLVIRRATAADSAFAYTVKRAAFRAYAEQVWGWDEDEQRRLHQDRFSRQDVSILQFQGQDVGVLSKAGDTECVRVHQLYILPDYQGKGIGSACMKRVLADAAALEKPVRLQVLKVNSRAIDFYHRLGFAAHGESDTHVQMEWSMG